MTNAEAWWEQFFDRQYAEIGLVPRGAEAERERDEAADFIIETLQLEPGQRLFDQCCGIGRISLPLARRGIHVVGVDRAPGYTEEARARCHGLPAEFHRADAADFVPGEPCDAAINWYTSFGYDDARNLKLLCRAFEALAPGASFILDYVNVPRTLANYQPNSCARRPWDGQGDLLVFQETTLDFHRGMFDTNWTYVYPDGSRQERKSATRSYLPNELVQLMQQAGFEDIQLYGSVEGEPYARLARRCILVGKRP